MPTEWLTDFTNRVKQDSANIDEEIDNIIHDQEILEHRLQAARARKRQIESVLAIMRDDTSKREQTRKKRYGTANGKSKRS